MSSTRPMYIVIRSTSERYVIGGDNARPQDRAAAVRKVVPQGSVDSTVREEVGA